VLCSTVSQFFPLFAVVVKGEHKNPTICELWLVIKYLNVKNVRPAEIHMQSV
jgi:hypothetical protein